jgi:hypothetical protein
MLPVTCALNWDVPIGFYADIEKETLRLHCVPLRVTLFLKRGALSPFEAGKMNSAPAEEKGGCAIV